MGDGDVAVVHQPVMRGIQSDPSAILIHLDPSVGRALSPKQAGNVARGQSHVPAHGQHHMGIILAYALALGQGLFGGGANRGGTGRVHKRLVDLIHHFSGLLHRSGVGRQRSQAFAAYGNHRLHGRAGNGER